MKISPYWKAIVAAFAAGAASIATALNNDDTITAAEGWTALIAVLAALGFTWAVPNKPATGEDPTA